jgi:ribosomal-protein-alanine N-acetyltransferase
VGLSFDYRLHTPRLTLRPTDAVDTPRICEIQSNWNVTRMLRLASYPPDAEAIRDWVFGHRSEWERGVAYRFGVLLDGYFVGCTDIDEIAGGGGDLGYWLDEAFWGRGLANEAASAVLRFGVDILKLEWLRSGHAADNPASGKVLTKLGFRWTDDVTKWSRSRQREIVHRS